jgi:transposase-like protein
MPMPWSPEVMAEVRRLVEETDRSYAEIEAATGVTGTTARYWMRTKGWRRPRTAPTRRRIPREQRAAIERALAAGASVHDVALIAERHPEVIRKHCPPGRRGDAAGEAEPVPASVAALCEALTAGGVGRDEFLRHAPQAFGIVVAQALLGRDPHVHRTAQALAHAAASVIRMPAAAPAPGASAYAGAHPGPQTYEETNACIEELAQLLQQFGALREDGSALDCPAAAEAPLLTPT